MRYRDLLSTNGLTARVKKAGKDVAAVKARYYRGIIEFYRLMDDDGADGAQSASIFAPDDGELVSVAFEGLGLGDARTGGLGYVEEGGLETGQRVAHRRKSNFE